MLSHHSAGAPADSPLERSLTFIGILSLASGCLGFSALKWRKRFLFAISFGLSMGVVVASWNVSVLVVFRSGADTQTGADNSGERNGTTAILDGSGSIENVRSVFGFFFVLFCFFVGGGWWWCLVDGRVG